MVKELDIEHERLRRELWVKVAVAYASTENSMIPDKMEFWANTAVDAFDAKFKVVEGRK